MGLVANLLLLSASLLIATFCLWLVVRRVPPAPSLEPLSSHAVELLADIEEWSSKNEDVPHIAWWLARPCEELIAHGRVFVVKDLRASLDQSSRSYAVRLRPAQGGDAK